MSMPGLSSTELTTSTSDPHVLRIQNHRAIGAMVAVVLGFVLFWPTTASLIEQWEDTVRRTYTHGFLIVAMTLWLLWRNRASWSRVEIKPSVMAALAVLLMSVVWLIAYRAGVRIAHQALLPAIIIGAFTASYGLQAARRNLLPFGFLYFAIPLWDTFNPWLQSASTIAVQVLLRTVGVPAYFSGNTFTLPSGSLEIAGGCSGLHFFVVGIAIAVFYGELNRDSTRVRIWMVVLAAVLAMLTNWLRIFIIAVAAHLTDMQHYLVREEHYSFGWMMFAGTMVAFFLIVRRWPLSAETSPTNVQPAPNTGAISWPGAALALTSLLVAPLWLKADSNTASLDTLPQLMPMNVTGWALQRPDSDWQPLFAGADIIQRASYSHGSETVEGFAALYLDQHQGKELIDQDNSVTGETLMVSRSARRTAANAWTEIEVTDSRGARWLVWYAYRLDSQWYSQGLAMQIRYGVRSLTSAPLTAVVALKTVCVVEDCATARSTLSEFATRLVSDSAR